MSEKEEEKFTLTQTELREFIDGLRAILIESITENNAQAMHALLETIFPPMMERLERLAAAQVTLATALRTNRRDFNATEFAKLFIERALRTSEGIDNIAVHVIPSEAYALAAEMDLHGRVAEVQAEDTGERMNKAVEAKPRHVSSKDFVDAFFKRKPKVDGPKVATAKPKEPKKN
jgi:hypothetical protein